jgi:hypothetical protein
MAPACVLVAGEGIIVQLNCAPAIVVHTVTVLMKPVVYVNMASLVVDALWHQDVQMDAPIMVSANPFVG